MKILIVVDEPENWPGVMHELPRTQAENIKILSAHDYLADPVRAAGDFNAPGFRIRVLKLCASYRYLSPGYYVSLLAEARGHKPLPKVGAVKDLQSLNLVRHLTEDLSGLIQRLLAPLAENEFELDTCFGYCVDNHYASLSRQLFGLFPGSLAMRPFRAPQESVEPARRSSGCGKLPAARSPENPYASDLELFLRQDSMGKKTSSSTF